MDKKDGQEGYESQGGRQPRRRAQKKKSPVWVRVLAAVAIAVAIALYLLGTFTDLIGIVQGDLQVQVEISDGSTSMEISNKLKESGVIDHPYVFWVLAGLKGDGAKFKAGEYVLNSNMSYSDIFSALKKGAERTDVVSITFFEGMTQREIAKKLESEGICKADEFHQYLANTEFDYEFARRIPEDDRFRPMEGYLFPDTYQFFKGEKVTSIVKKFLDRFAQKFTDELYSKSKDLGMTLDDVITLSSILQEECSNVDEMAMVASVFHNRLNNPSEFPKLQSDVTIFYVNDNIIPYMKTTNQALYDQYNTYVCEGLPLGPISSPGTHAIEAVLNPAKSNYYFFLTDKEGKFYYARTLAEHNANIRKAGL